MTNLKKRELPKTNASLISMVQRFSDISIMFAGLWMVCKANALPFLYMHLLMALLTLVVFQMIGGMTDFYRSWRGVKISSELFLLLQNWTLSVVFSAGLLAFNSDFDGSFWVYLAWYVLSGVGMVICRSWIRFAAGWLRNKGFNTRRVAIAGSLPVGQLLAQSFKNEPWLGFNVLGVYDDEPPAGALVSYIGNFNTLVADARNGQIDKVYIAMEMSHESRIKKLVSELADTTCSVLLIPDVFTFNILNARTEEVNGVPVVPLFETPLSGFNSVLKRLEDIVLSSFILLLISPVLICISLAVKLTSPGPVIFRQTRYGMDGKPIKVWKFRSMKVMENDAVVVQATKGDSRITPVGSFLRRTSLDELPQFINVLLGGMSIVGPRPHAVAHNEQYRALIEGYMLRHKVKPGITGWAQINGWRGETDTLDKMEKRVEFDLEYIREWSLWFDIKIVFLTVFKGFVNKAAY
ncbi:undecaprenyl-phosphate glucose phosphotransferase [Enterobacter sp. Cy-643]|uniref:undecaprenyl-phosphate glucose phosphotransferase n=1 Tax=Enterobacter sp. Cy-643 TaxID=2608346 RepID=UPI001423B101|nr:undecaprenyl-phosphate glucose phosphotransferase [Enterobacter sp. Cy-643]NIF31108.1 undecaprenyl-phosphate glucose phosphotransferase [Enterobacter sp. Cy-643]